MKNWFSLLSITFVVMLAGAPASASAIAFSHFDNPADGVDGWTLFSDAIGPTYQLAGGNPGGFVRAVDMCCGPSWAWLAPGKFLGDVSAAYGGSLSFDLRQSGVTNQYNDDDVVLTGGGLMLVFDTSYNPGPIWTSFSVPLLASAGWRVGAFFGPAASEAQLQAVLSDLTGLRIRGEFESFVVDTGDLDNVVLATATVPEPATIWLVGLGAATFCALRSKSRRL